MVYCKNCKHYMGVGIQNDYLCWVKKERNYMGIRLGNFCVDLNHNKNCEKYKRKWWKFWL